MTQPGLGAFLDVLAISGHVQGGMLDLGTNLALLRWPALTPMRTDLRPTDPLPVWIVRRLVFSMVTAPDILTFHLFLGGRGAWQNVRINAAYLANGFMVPPQILTRQDTLRFEAMNISGAALGEPIQAQAEVLMASEEKLPMILQMIEQATGMPAHL